MEKDPKRQPPQESQETPEDGSYLSVGLCLGMSIGLCLGMAVFENPALGLGIGMSIGVGVGAALDAARKKQKKDGNDHAEH